MEDKDAQRGRTASTTTTTATTGLRGLLTPVISFLRGEGGAEVVKEAVEAEEAVSEEPSTDQIERETVETVGEQLRVDHLYLTRETVDRLDLLYRAPVAEDEVEERPAKVDTSSTTFVYRESQGEGEQSSGSAVVVLPGRLRSSGHVDADESTADFYAKLHRFPEQLEKRQKRREREQLLHERHKLRERLETLRYAPPALWLPSERARGGGGGGGGGRGGHRRPKSESSISLQETRSNLIQEAETMLAMYDRLLPESKDGQRLRQARRAKVEAAAGEEEMADTHRRSHRLKRPLGERISDLATPASDFALPRNDVFKTLCAERR